MSLRCLIIGLLLVVPSAASAQEGRKPAKADKMIRVTYPVADLVVPIPTFTAKDTGKTDEDTLIQLITHTIARNTWDCVGGDGQIQYFPTGMAIVVNQRASVQQEIADLLASLRKLQDVQVSIETRWIEVSHKVSRRLLKDMDDVGQIVRVYKEPGRRDESKDRCVSIDDRHSFMLLEMLQGERTCSITQPPKMTLFNGQRARMDTTIKENGEIIDGIRYHALPVVDPEQKLVRLSLDLEHYTKRTDSKPHLTHAKQTFMLLPGRTLLWHLGELPESGGRRHLFVMVIPRVHVEEATEVQARPPEVVPVP